MDKIKTSAFHSFFYLLFVFFQLQIVCLRKDHSLFLLFFCSGIHFRKSYRIINEFSYFSNKDTQIKL